MNIFTVADFFYPGVTGGASIVIYEVMRRLVGRGHRVTVLTRKGETTPSNIAGMGLFYYQAPRQEQFYPLAVARCAQKVWHLFRQNDYEVVNIHHAFSGLAVELCRHWYGKIPSVFYYHGPWHKEAMAKDQFPLERRDADDKRRLPLKYLFRKRTDRYILKHCTAVVGLSDYMLREAESIFPGVTGKAHKIPGGVDIERFRPVSDKAAVRRELGLPADMFIVLTVRRLAARMGLENLIKAMVRIERERKDILLIIGGKGEFRPQLEGLIRSLGLERTRLLGYIDDERLPRFYQTSDLFVMPSLFLEGFGLATLEALACGLPVLGTPVGGTPEILRDLEPEWILPGTSPEELAQGILRQAARPCGMGQRQVLVDFAQRYHWERITDTVETLFLSLAGGRPGGCC